MEEEHVVEQVDDIQDIIEDVARQNTLEENNKRDRTADAISNVRTKISKWASDVTLDNQSPDASGEDDDDDPIPKKLLNSTPNPLNPPKRKITTLNPKQMDDHPKEIEHYFSEGGSHQRRVQPPANP